MELGARQGCVIAPTLRDKMLVLKELGYDFLELALTRKETDALDEAAIDSYCALAQETGLPIKLTSMGHFTGLAGLDDEERAVILSHVRQMVNLTSALGGDAILLATAEQDLPFEEYAPGYKEWMKETGDYAQERSVLLAMEHVGKFKPGQVGELVRAIEHLAVGLYFDMGNCLWTEVDPVEQARALGDITVQLHIKGAKETPLSEMPLVAIREALAAHNYQGHGCLEISGKENNDHLKEALVLLEHAGYR